MKNKLWKGCILPSGAILGVTEGVITIDRSIKPIYGFSLEFKDEFKHLYDAKS